MWCLHSIKWWSVNTTVFWQCSVTWSGKSTLFLALTLLIEESLSKFFYSSLSAIMCTMTVCDVISLSTPYTVLIKNLHFSKWDLNVLKSVKIMWQWKKKNNDLEIIFFVLKIRNSVAATGSEIFTGNDVICHSSSRPSLSWSIRRWKCVTDPQSVPSHVFSQLHGFHSRVILATGSHQAEQTFC